MRATEEPKKLNIMNPKQFTAIAMMSIKPTTNTLLNPRFSKI